MKYILEIDCDNDAFQAASLNEELARILTEVVERINDGDGVAVGFDMGLYDTNGNKVGTARLINE